MIPLEMSDEILKLLIFIIRELSGYYSRKIHRE